MLPMPYPYTPPTPCHRDELRRLHKKMAYYELPITDFAQPVDNEPWHTGPVLRMNVATRSEAAARKMKERQQRCALERLAHRAADFVRALFRSNRSKGKRTINGKKGYTLHGGIHDEIASVLSARGGGSSYVLDEGTRFRLQLAGLQLPQPSQTNREDTNTIMV